MAASSRIDGVRELADTAARAAGLLVEAVTVTPVGRRRVLRVVLDLPDDVTGGVPMEAVEAASRALSEALDTAGDVMGETPYVLEVSSPGADRPLTQPRHWRRARGRSVKVTVGGRVLTGRLEAVDAEGVVIGGAAYPWSQLGTGRIELEFARPGDTADPGDGEELEDPGDGEELADGDEARDEEGEV